MSQKILSVFIDESGDFGSYDSHSPLYLVSVVLHNQEKDISEKIKFFDSHLTNIGYTQHAIHTGPLIRRESIYKNDLVEKRKQLFNTLFHFARKLNFQYFCIKIRKNECSDKSGIISKVSESLSKIIQNNSEYWNRFAKIIIYYDNGQQELTKILESIFNTLYTHVEFRKVSPVDYRLLQIADLICTLELLAEKSDSYSFSRSELEFFGNIRNYKKNYLKYIRQKIIL